MGLWTTIKNWLNIGGVKVQLSDYSEAIRRSNPVVSGTVLLRSKSDKCVLGLEVKVIEEFTKSEGEGQEKRSKTTTTVLGSVKFPDYNAGIGYPLDLKPGEDKEQTFSIPIAMTERLQNAGGILGGIGKLASWVAQEKVEYSLVAEAPVKGAAFSPWDRKTLKVAD